MSEGTCDYCGGDIIFRWMGFGVVPIHLSGSCSAGTTGAAAAPRSSSSVSVPLRNAAPASEHWRVGHARSDSGERMTHPTRCPLCDAVIFFHTNGYGDVVFFDDLGPPWPKHPCLTSDEGYRRASTSVDLMRLVDLRSPPRTLSMPVDRSRSLSVLAFSASFVGRTVTGLVLATAARRAATEETRPRGRKTSLTVVDLGLAKGSVLRVYLDGWPGVAVGEILRARLVRRSVGGRASLYAAEWERVAIPADVFPRSPEPEPGGAPRLAGWSAIQVAIWNCALCEHVDRVATLIRQQTPEPAGVARLAIIGIAPPYQAGISRKSEAESMTNSPGDRLRRFLETIVGEWEAARTQGLIALHAVKCAIVPNRDGYQNPPDHVVDTCAAQHLAAELRQSKPPVVVTLGAAAYRGFVRAVGGLSLTVPPLESRPGRGGATLKLEDWTARLFTSPFPRGRGQAEAQEVIRTAWAVALAPPRPTAD